MRNERLRLEDLKKSKKLQVRRCRNRVIFNRKENGGVPSSLAVGLGHVRYSLLFVGVEQRWRFIAMQGGEYCARRIRWQLVIVPYSYF